MTIDLSNFFEKEVTVTLRDERTITGTITASYGKVSPGIYARYRYFMDTPHIDEILTWTNAGRWDSIESRYDIISIVETSPKMNTKQQLLKSIQETEQQLEKLKKQLEQQKAPTIQEAKVGVALEDGSIVIKKENGLALLIAPKSTEVQCQWTKEFPEVYSKLTEEGFISSQWFVPTVKQLQLAYKVIPDEFNKAWYWSSSEFNASTSWIINFKGGAQFSLKSDNCHVRSFRCVCY